MKNDISIHALRKERDSLDVMYDVLQAISIHALRKERDPPSRRSSLSSQNFNPRAPQGARPLNGGVGMLRNGFQSTRSARSATLLRSASTAHRQFQSTRSARSATGFCTRRRQITLFQSTRSARSATSVGEELLPLHTISIHALRKERDWMQHICRELSTVFQSTRSARSATLPTYKAHRKGQISIHALRKERDDSPDSQFSTTRNFNPRAPQGARLLKEIDAEWQKLFQSTRSARSATNLAGRDKLTFAISIHALRKERDPFRLAFRLSPSNFNPRAPQGARRLAFAIPEGHHIFQSTRSARSATCNVTVNAYSSYISIHALRKERDLPCR